MAIFGNINNIEKQIDKELFKIAFEYITKIFDDKSKEYKRLQNLNIGDFVKVELDSNNFALEQVYYTKERENTFFESHKKYIDVQVILEGEEEIEVENIKYLIIKKNYNFEEDLIIYQTPDKRTSIIKLKTGDIAIFFPEDAHMPCIKYNNIQKIIKTVIKVKI